MAEGVVVSELAVQHRFESVSRIRIAEGREGWSSRSRTTTCRTISDPASELVADETAGRIQAELARLPRLQREVFLLRVQQGMDYGEIAAALGTTAGAARVHYHHAIKRLKELAQ